MSGPMYQQEIWMLGEHSLADLKDRIRCPVDFNIVGRQQAGSWSPFICWGVLSGLNNGGIRAVDPHSFFSDPDPAFFFNADPNLV